MTIAEALKDAVTRDDAQMCGRISNQLRDRGFNYFATQAMAVRLTGCTADEWETLIHEADRLESQA